MDYARKKDPSEILDDAYGRAEQAAENSLIKDAAIRERIALVATEPSNSSGARVLLACVLAKADDPTRDIRRPYDAIGDNAECTDNYSGRKFDEKYIAPFRTKHSLPIIPTTGLLTPAWRTKNITLTPDVKLKGRPPKMYAAALQLLTDIQERKVSAEDVLAETLRLLVLARDKRKRELTTALRSLAEATSSGGVQLSAEAIITLIGQHLASPRSSRLPVLVVAAAYKAASDYLREKVLPLKLHNAADVQTGAYGDIEITLLDDDSVITAYEMKDKEVRIRDIDEAVELIAQRSSEGFSLDNLIIITTYPIDKTVHDYAAKMYEKTGGIEIVVLDCLSFLRHFLHLFHRLRIPFLDEYQALLLGEPPNTVRPELKLTFLSLRKAAESSK